MAQTICDAVEARLGAELARLRPEELGAWLSRRRGELLQGERPFADYMRRKLREKDILQQNVFLAADLPERYGYKLISGKKHTTRRDTILRLCLAARFDLRETDEALILYGMAPLYPKIPRDAAFIVAISSGVYDIHDVDAILRENGLAPFLE